MPGENLDLSSESEEKARSQKRAPRRYVGVHFACCGVYDRIYVNCQATAYQGYCPKCSRRVQFRIGPGGTENRFFTAY